ncbi:hypothetical protein Vafri_5533 [Volvox africanus]|uniref:Uncharacterized protein n=1 Tax=Volvox africanus TaxID=51714 RepID=A0A8J4AWF7_9CHLO|nr:hypothetical protein Vafri_5533 [Volvox africanus]
MPCECRIRLMTLRTLTRELMSVHLPLRQRSCALIRVAARAVFLEQVPVCQQAQVRARVQCEARGRGGPPSAAAAHGAGNEAKRQRTDDPWLKKWGCTQSELTRRRKEKVCLRCAGGHPTRDCPMLPPLAQQPK